MGQKADMNPEIRPNIQGTRADDAVYLGVHLLPLLFPYATIFSAVVLAMIGTSMPEPESDRRDAAFSFAASLLAMGATALQFSGSRERRAGPEPAPAVITLAREAGYQTTSGVQPIVAHSPRPETSTADQSPNLGFRFELSQAAQSTEISN